MCLSIYAADKQTDRGSELLNVFKNTTTEAIKSVAEKRKRERLNAFERS